MRNPQRDIKTLLLCLVACCTIAGGSANAQWVLVDSTSFSDLLAAGDRCYLSIQSSTDYLQLTVSPDNLTPSAEMALGRAPLWLQRDLRDNFRRLGETTQDLYAGLINDAVDPYIDEICFEVAHLSPQTLAGSMPPQILVENVELLYTIDSYLDYADIVDYDIGDDYYSTILYRVQEGEDVQEIELPRDTYYWYVVHPKLHKETPNYINPDTGYPADPPTGVFWRDFLMNHHDGGYPLLRSALDTCSVLWKAQQNTVDNGAVGAVTQWIQDVMTFQSYPHHDQPARIYRLHVGTCSVHSYITSAAARASLIPALVDVMYSDNHKINEFWDRRWIAWEPVNTYVDYPGGYENWGWNVAAAFNWRGDSFIWDATERYTEVCTLNVSVMDNAGNPVDGARIKLYSSPCQGWGATAGWTSHDGRCRFLLGDSRTFMACVTSSVGNYPPSGMETVIINSQVGSSYDWDVVLLGAVPRIDVSPDSLPGNPTNDYRLVVEYSLPVEIVYGTNLDDGNEFSDAREVGHVDFFICDEGNFDDYVGGESFRAFEIRESSSSDTVDFVLASPDSWYAVFSTEADVVLTQDLCVTAKLYASVTSSVAEGDGDALFTGVRLCANYPNPFKQETQIRFKIAHAGETELSIYDLSGRQIRSLVRGFQAMGEHGAVWDGRDDYGHAVGSGIYFYRLTMGGSEEIRKLVRMR